jgi:hypothetical protein
MDGKERHGHIDRQQGCGIAGATAKKFTVFLFLLPKLALSLQRSTDFCLHHSFY